MMTLQMGLQILKGQPGKLDNYTHHQVVNTVRKQEPLQGAREEEIGDAIGETEEEAISENTETKFLCISMFKCISVGDQFLAPLAKGQQAIVMVLCPSCVRLSVRACVRKLFLQKTSPQKLLTGFLQNFTGMFLRWSSFKFLQIIMFYEEFWLPWRSK